MIVLVALIAIVASACSSDPATPPDPQSLIDRAPGLVRPASVHVASTDTDRDRATVHIAQQLYTFWNTGDPARLDAAVGPEFRDNTLPSGRPQGPSGPVAASSTFRAAIPDLTCELADLYVTGDTFTARLVFAGSFTGTYNGVRGAGQPIRFGAIDIQHVGAGGKIVEDWHLEDNLTFLQQAGLVTVASAPSRN
ncbi:ester cyclase [Williamsia maris]|uniref:Ester cyclase n=2 Tax=Williamsia maris TaxID=72806 RepID=A0ABT1HFV6_9NOCA|nr:putative ester cyclase [Williamsia maris]